MALPSDRRPEEFLAFWTAKEAYLKATGAGIAAGLPASTPPGWQLERLCPAPGYAGAVAYRQTDRDLAA
jgi:4'-phosphopantetheinyl transferase